MSAPQAIHDFDDRVDVAFDRIRGNRYTDRLFYSASFAGDHSAIWVLLALLRAWSDGDWYVASRVLIAIPCESFLVNVVIKSLFRRGRPLHNGERPHRLRRPRTSSFPSGHATSAFMAATLLSWNSDWVVAYFALAILIAASRIYVKIHHASDVIAGAVFGLALGIGIRVLAF
jgi:undecaprenyl-diphosphatase